MPTLLQLATFFNLFSSVLVLGLSVLTLRLTNSTFFRYWVASYAFAICVTFGVTIEAILGRHGAIFLLYTAALMPAIWFMGRLGYELLARPYPGAKVAAGLGVVYAAGVALWAVGPGYEAAVVPGALATVFTHVWLGAVMVQAHRTPRFAGIGWVGLPLVAHGVWLMGYPVLAGTRLFWLGFTVAAVLEIAIGVGMAMYALIHTTRLLAARNASLEAAEAAMREADRLQREFLNAASHELRTPLTTIVGYAEFLEEPLTGRLNGRQAEYVAQIRRGASRLSRLVDDMLDFAVLEAGTFVLMPQRVDVAAIMRSEAESLLPQSREKQVRLALDLPAGPLVAWADPLRVAQVLSNLVNNALKFTPAGGEARLTATTDGETVRVAVSDNGVGIAEEHLPHLFQKFFRVDSSSTRLRGGAGLGLPISRALIEAHGGAIGVETRPGHGSTFWFTLPVAPPAALEESST